MLKYERVWTAGGQFFTTCEEARAYLTLQRAELLRESLIDVIQSAWRSEPDVDKVADAIVAKFKLTPRK